MALKYCRNTWQQSEVLDLNVIQVDKEPSPGPTHAEIIFTYALHENQNFSSYQQP